MENLDTAEKDGLVENEIKTLDNVLTAAEEVVMDASGPVESVTLEIEKATDLVEALVSQL